MPRSSREQPGSIGFPLLPLLLLLPALLVFFFPRISTAATWEKHFSWDYNEEGASIVETPGNGFVIAGTTHSFGPGAPDLGNPFLMKVDSLGNLLWSQAYGSTLDEYMRCVALAPDGGFIMCGTRVSQDSYTSKYYVVKTDSGGQFQWERTYGPEDAQCDALSITPVRLGGYVLSGSSASYRYHTPGEFLIIRMNMMGNVMWQYKYSEPDYSNYAWSIQELPDGGFIVGGGSQAVWTNDRRMILMRLTSQGSVKWTRHFDPNLYAGCYSVRLTSDGGFILGGYTRPSGGYSIDVCLLKTDSEGNKQWMLTCGGTGGSEYLYSVQQTTDGSYVGCGLTTISGHGQQDLCLILADATGRLVWSRAYGGPLGDYGYSVINTSDGGYAMTGVESSWGPGTNIYAIKTDANGNVHAEKSAPAAIRLSPLQLTVAPNPFVSFSTVPGRDRETFSVYDVLGRRVGRYPGDRIGPDLPPGVYMLRPNQGADATVRIVKTR